MTPAINIAKKNKISYKIREYEHDPASESYGLEAAEKLGLSKGVIRDTHHLRFEKGEFNLNYPVNFSPFCSFLEMVVIFI